jgi:hypothetical protein
MGSLDRGMGIGMGIGIGIGIGSLELKSTGRVDRWDG